jgi:hypothetical protein
MYILLLYIPIITIFVYHHHIINLHIMYIPSYYDSPSMFPSYTNIFTLYSHHIPLC